MTHMRSILYWVGGLFICLLLAESPVVAQATSRVMGRVSDASGAVLPGTEITASNERTGVARTAVSAVDGYFHIPDLIAGPYTIRASLPGFKTAVHQNIQVTAESVVQVNLVLEVGEIAEAITVRSDAGQQVETQLTRISQVLSDDEVTELPAQGRGFMNLVMISPGIVGKQTQRSDCCDVFSNFSAPRINSGANEQKASFQLDGVDMRIAGGSGYAMIFSPSPDAIQELRISTDPYSAEYGRSSGPMVNISTKGGTNSFHGTAHYLFNSDQLNARSFFGGPQQPRTRYHLFGGTAGGPVLRDKLFFFGAYEGLRSVLAAASRATVETQQFRDFVVNTRPNSVAARYLQSFPPFSYPTEGLVDLGSPLPGVFQWDPTPDGIPDIGIASMDNPFERNGNQFNGRIDFHHPNGQDRFFASYWQSFPRVEYASPRPAMVPLEESKVQSFHLTHTRPFSPNFLHEARYGHNLIDYSFGGSSFRPFVHFPSISTDDGLRFGFTWADAYYRVHYFEEVVSLHKGRHSFKFGGTYRRVISESERPSQPSYRFANVLDFANDEPFFESRVIDPQGGQAPNRVSPRDAGDAAVFSQNTWLITPTLTLNYGLRWEYFFRMRLTRPEVWQPHLSSSQINPQAVASVVNSPIRPHLYGRDLNNLSPRLGLAWDPSGERRLVLRFGFGLLYDEINTLPVAGLDTNPPTLASVAAGLELGIPIIYGIAPEGTTDFPINPELRSPQLSEAGGIVGQRVQLTGFMTDLQAPQILDTLAGIQYELTRDTMVQLNYKYRRGVNELHMDDVNRFQGDLLDGVLNRLNPNFSEIYLISNRGRRISHNVVASLSRRFSDGWSLTANYNYIHARNNFGSVVQSQSDFYQSGNTDPFHLDLDWVRDDIPHVFTAHSLWELPFLRGRRDVVGQILGGWKLSSIWNFQSGPIFSVTSIAPYGSGGDFNGDGHQMGFRGVGGDRPDAPTQQLPKTFSKQEWLDGALSPSLFPLPNPADPRPGTLPRDAFRQPGYASIDVNLLKEFPVPAWGENGKFQIRAEFLNVANRLNISQVGNRLNQATFARATAAHPNRVVQVGVKLLF